jgi:predicted MFS family arabinose efflux permease
LYAATPALKILSLATAVYLILFAILGAVFPIVMEALTSLNASIRGTISSLANSAMNGANTLGAWVAGLLYAQLGGFPSIGMFSAVCLALSLGTFLLGGVPRSKEARTGQGPASAS